ncbi:DMT family transporter [Leucobacter zeae]|nr:DMT family transporter [Leucobacter zeae]
MNRAALLLVTVIWGVNFVSARFALDAMSPWGFRAVSFGAGAAILFALAPILRVRLRLPRRIDLLHLAVAGTFGIAGFGVLSAVSLLNTTAGRTSIVVYTMPIWVALLGRVWLGERLGPRRVVSVWVGIAGLAVLLVPLLRGGPSLGELAALGAALSWALGTVYLKWAAVDAAPLAITAWQLGAGAVVSLVALALDGGPVFRAAPDAAAWAGIVYSTLIGTVFAYVLWFQVVQRLPASVAGLGTLLVPVFGMAAGMLLLGEHPTAADIAGFALIFIAGLLALGGPAVPASRVRAGRAGRAPGSASN